MKQSHFFLKILQKTVEIFPNGPISELLRNFLICFYWKLFYQTKTTTTTKSSKPLSIEILRRNISNRNLEHLIRHCRNIFHN